MNNMLGVRKMKTEDLPLNIKEIFEKKGEKYSPEDIARARHVCRTVVENVIALLKRCVDEKQSQLKTFFKP